MKVNVKVDRLAQRGPQTAFVECTRVDIVCYGGSRCGGKSRAMALDFWLHAERNGLDAKGLMLRKTREDLKDFAKAKADGKMKGRPEDVQRNRAIMAMLRSGQSWNTIVTATGASRSTLAKLAKRLAPAMQQTPGRLGGVGHTGQQRLRLRGTVKAGKMKAQPRQLHWFPFPIRAEHSLRRCDLRLLETFALRSAGSRPAQPR